MRPPLASTAATRRRGRLSVAARTQAPRRHARCVAGACEQRRVRRGGKRGSAHLPGAEPSRVACRLVNLLPDPAASCTTGWLSGSAAQSSAQEARRRRKACAPMSRARHRSWRPGRRAREDGRGEARNFWNGRGYLAQLMMPSDRMSLRTSGASELVSGVAQCRRNARLARAVPRIRNHPQLCLRPRLVEVPR